MSQRYGWTPPYGKVYHWMTDLQGKRGRALAVCGAEVRAVSSDGNYGRRPCERCQTTRGVRR